MNLVVKQCLLLMLIMLVIFSVLTKSWSYSEDKEERWILLTLQIVGYVLLDTFIVFLFLPLI